MADLNTNCSADGSFKEAVCIDAGRVYDSCCDRDCLEDLRCLFTADAQALVNNAISVRLRTAEVLNVYIDVQPVNFNKGFYSCDLTFFFQLGFDLYTAPNTCPESVMGIATYSKRVILYGSDGNVKLFTNTVNDVCETTNPAVKSTNSPKCVVQAVDPIPLSARIGEIRDCYENVCCIPKCVCECVGGDVVTDTPTGTPTIFVTLGLFTVIQLIRNVQMLIPVYDFCIPEKVCTDSTDRPCDAFKKIKFPTEDFFPPKSYENQDCGCGCSNSEN